MSITREEFLKGLEKGNLGYYESVLRLAERVNLKGECNEVKDGDFREVEIQEHTMYEQIRIDRVTGEVEKVITSLHGIRKYKELINKEWYRKAFNLESDNKELRVHIKDINIDAIPDERIVTVYFSYLNYYDCIEYNDTKGNLDKRIESHQKIARDLFIRLKANSDDFDPIILDVINGKYKINEKRTKPKLSLVKLIKQKLFGR